MNANKKLSLLCSLCFIFLLRAVSGEEDAIYKNAVGFDIAGPFYNQYLVSYERLVIDHLSVNIAGGGSPKAEYLSPTFRYLYFQTEIRGYPLSKSIDKLYTGFGVGMYFSDTLIDFSQWNLTQDKKGSTEPRFMERLVGNSSFRQKIKPALFS